MKKLRIGYFYHLFPFEIYYNPLQMRSDPQDSPQELPRHARFLICFVHGAMLHHADVTIRDPRASRGKNQLMTRGPLPTSNPGMKIEE